MVHLVILVPDFVGQATSPRFDLIYAMLFFVVSCFADIHLPIGWCPAWSAFCESRVEHYKAPVDQFVDLVVSILSSFEDLVRPKVLLKMMYSLLGSVIPARVHPLLTVGIFPSPVDLSRNRLGDIISVSNVHPVTNFPHFFIMSNSFGPWLTTFISNKIRVWSAHLNLREFLSFSNQGGCILKNLAAVFVKVLGIFEHEFYFQHEVIY